MKIHSSRNTGNAHTIIPQLTDLMKVHGYSAVTMICRKAGQDLTLLKKLIAEKFYDKKD